MLAGRHTATAELFADENVEPGNWGYGIDCSQGKKNSKIVLEKFAFYGLDMELESEPEP